MMKSLIVLQENTGRIALPDGIDGNLQTAIFGIIDNTAEPFEDFKTQLQASGRYAEVVLLTNQMCSRKNLLDALIDQTKKNRIIDLLVLGHGNNQYFVLHGQETINRAGIRSLIDDARLRGVNALNLRMVYMCNCYGSVFNDAWIAIGAKASVGSRENDYMPEPMITFFVHNWLNGQMIRDAARNAYNATALLYQVIYPPTLRPLFQTITIPYPCPTWDNPFKMCEATQQIPYGVEPVTHAYITASELIVTGDGNILF
ncbi:MAG: hypothetical protein ACTFAK_00695 [Candidatus Electronema sp. VV]